MAAKKNKSTETNTPKNAYFLSLELENVRCFGERQKIDFSDGNGSLKQWTIILGDNGTGKTTLLQCILYSYLVAENGSLISLKSNMESFVDTFHKRKKYSTKSITSKYKINFNYLTKLGFNELGMESSGSLIINAGLMNGLLPSEYYYIEGNKIKSKLFAYGASRKAGETSISQDEESAFITLFDETLLLLNPEEWLIRSHYQSLLESNYQAKRKQKLKKVIEILKTILPDLKDIRFGEKQLENKRSQPIVEFKTPYGWVEAKDLSLGYRTSMAWMVDFAARMFDFYPESENPLAEPAVVLIDEIDLHLHPKWQRDLLDWLSDLCPNTQFIVTTHSPLIVQSGLEHDANIFVCRRNEEKDFVEIEQINEHLKTLRVDQILSGDYFEVPPRGAKTEKLLDEKEAILSKPKLTKSDEKRLAELDEKIGFLPVSENQKENEVMQVLKEAADWVKTNGKK